MDAPARWPGVDLRQARPSDVSHVVDLWHAMRREAQLEDHLLLEDWRPRLEAFLRDTLDGGEAVAWVADAHGTLVGSALGLLKADYPFFLNRPGVYGFIGCVYTAPPWRRQGLASHLVARAISWLRERGARTVRLLPTEASRPIYERMGFGPVDDMELRLE